MTQTPPPLPSRASGDRSDSDEPRLIDRAKRDPRAFGALYDRYVDRVYRYCHRRTGSHYDAEELTAQTFRRALEALPRYEWRGAPFGAWLFRIAANLIVDRATGRKSLSLETLTETGREPEDGCPQPLDGLLAEEEIDALWQAVYQLVPQQQQVLVLRYAQGLTTRETARIVNRSETATKQLVYRSLKALRERLVDHEPATSA